MRRPDEPGAISVSRFPNLPLAPPVFRAGFFRRVGVCAGFLLASVLPGLAAAQPDDAYLDETARRLITGARAARDASLAEILSYKAVVQERVAVAATASSRSYPLMSGEHVSRLRWFQDQPNVVRVLGSRVRFAGLPIGGLFQGIAARYAANPLQDPFHFALSSVLPHSRATMATFLRSPLEAGSERDYQFRSGDTISLALPGNRSVQVVAVTATPRFRSVQLLSAVMWIEPESYGLARTVYRLSKKIDSEFEWSVTGEERWPPALRIDPGDGAEDEGSEEAIRVQSGRTFSASDRHRGRLDRFLDGIVNNLMPPTEMDVTSVVADYTLWELSHWLPRSVRVAGYLRSGDETDLDSPNSILPFIRDWTFTIEEVQSAETGGLPPATARSVVERWREDGDSIDFGTGPTDGPNRTITIIPRNRAALAINEGLPPPIQHPHPDFPQDDALLRGAARTVADSGAAGNPQEGARGRRSPWAFEPPLWTLRLLRYNRVEGLSVGTRLRRRLAKGTGVATLRAGTLRREPSVDLTLDYGYPGRRHRFSLYHALRQRTPLGERRRIAPLNFAADPADYYVATGVALQLLPSRDERLWGSLTLFAERQLQVGGFTGTPPTRQMRAGGLASWKPWWGRSQYGSWSGGGNAALEGWLGDNPAAKASLTGALLISLSARLLVAAEAGAARLWGDPSPHDLWRLGGGGEWLRGYPSGALSGEAVQKVRAEIQYSVPLLRLALFGDWAASGDQSLRSAGLGVSFMEGLIRVDVARGLAQWKDPVLAKEPDVWRKPGWALHLRTDTRF